MINRQNVGPVYVSDSESDRASWSPQSPRFEDDSSSNDDAVSYTSQEWRDWEQSWWDHWGDSDDDDEDPAPSSQGAQ